MPLCPWCNKPMHRVTKESLTYACNNKSCRGYNNLIQFSKITGCPKCECEIFFQYRTKYGELKECSACRTHYDVKRFVKKQSIQYRIDHYNRTIKRLESLRDAQ